jgi:hypothetical protein
MGAKRNRELKAEPNNSYNSQWGNWMIRRYQVDEDERLEALKKGLRYEEDLPSDISKEDYDKWYKTSRLVYGVRMGEVFPK